MRKRTSKSDDHRVVISHSYEEAVRLGAPKDKLKSLREKRVLYADIERRLSNGLFPEDAMTALLNQIAHLASTANLSVETFSGWLYEEAEEYASEQAAGGFSAIASHPQRHRQHELDVHLHFARLRLL